MQTDNRILDDMARVFAGALCVAGGARAEMRHRMRQHAELLLQRMDLVRREEFDVVRDMSILAREENERLERRIEELENALKRKGQRKRGS